MDHPRPRRSKLFQAASVALFNLVLLEILSFLAVHALGIVRPNRRLDTFVDAALAEIDDATISRYFELRYDPQLGWGPQLARTRVNTAGEQWSVAYDSTGSRKSCLPHLDVTVATYGDSYTEGTEVNDDETWQCVLEVRTGRRVANYGVSAYGIDQALARAKRHWNQGNVAPVTILVIYEEDLDRVVSRWQGFLHDPNNLRFKPAYRYLDGEVVFFPNPLDPEMTSKDEVRALLIELAKTDYWASGAARVVAKFPYSIRLLAVVRYAVQNIRGTSVYETELWDSPEGRAILNYLLDDFEQSARAAGTRPALLFIPVVNNWAEGRATPRYANFLREERLQDSSFIVIDVADAEFDLARFSILPFRGHPSVFGNEVIAGHILATAAPDLDLER